MRSCLPRLSVLALVLASIALPPRLAGADESATSKFPLTVPSAPPSAPLTARTTSAPALSPLRAAIDAAAEPRMPVSAALVVTGGITAGVGAVGALAGLLLMTVSPASCVGSSCGAGRQDAGRVALFVGAPVLAAGLAMVVVGIQPAAQPENEHASSVRLVPTVAVGPTGGAVRWTF